MMVFYELISNSVKSFLGNVYIFVTCSSETFDGLKCSIFFLFTEMIKK